MILSACASMCVQKTLGAQNSKFQPVFNIFGNVIFWILSRFPFDGVPGGLQIGCNCLVCRLSCAHEPRIFRGVESVNALKNGLGLANFVHVHVFEFLGRELGRQSGSKIRYGIQNGLLFRLSLIAAFPVFQEYGSHYCTGSAQHGAFKTKNISRFQLVCEQISNANTNQIDDDANYDSRRDGDLTLLPVFQHAFSQLPLHVEAQEWRND